jgi:hypothetical protein
MCNLVLIHFPSIDPKENGLFWMMLLVLFGSTATPSGQILW